MRNNKYHARKVTVDGIVFDSQKEASRYKVLKLMQRAGKITGLMRQVEFVLIPAQRGEIWSDKKHKFVSRVIERKCSYYADFVYSDENGNTVVEDTKGMRTPEYVIKRKLMLEQYGIRIREV